MKLLYVNRFQAETLQAFFCGHSPLRRLQLRLLILRRNSPCETRAMATAKSAPGHSLLFSTFFGCRGRDAGDVPITMVFGQSRLENFSVVTDEIEPRSTASLAEVA